MRRLLLAAVAAAAMALPQLATAMIAHGPYLTNLGNREVTVNFYTDAAAPTGVAYRRSGDTDWLVVNHTVAGQIATDTAAHHIRLAELAPGTDYEYKLLGYDADGNALDLAAIGHFRTMGASSSSFWITADLQESGSRQSRIEKLNSILPMNSCDTGVILGDFCDWLDDFEAETLRNCIDHLVRIGAGSTPLVMVRGNHEWRGRDSRLWSREMSDLTTNRNYFTIEAGPDLVIVLDAGEDKPAKFSGHNYTNLNDDQGYFREQRRWLEQVAASEVFKKARYRIVLTHCGTHCNSPGYDVKNVNMLIDGLFGTTPENRVQLMLAGHAHYYMRSFQGEDANNFYRPDSAMIARKRATGRDYPYNLVVVDGPGCGGSDASVSKLTLDETGIGLSTWSLEGELIESLHFDQEGNGSVVEGMGNLVERRY